MSFGDLTDPVFEAIKEYLGNGVSTGAWQLAPIRYPNDPFEIPDGPWVDFEIAGQLFGQQSIGAETQAANRWDEEGQIYLHVIVPTGSGSTRVRGAAWTLASLFRGKTLLSGQLEFLDASIGLGDPGNEEGNSYRVTVSVDWRHWDA